MFIIILLSPHILCQFKYTVPVTTLLPTSKGNSKLLLGTIPYDPLRSLFVDLLGEGKAPSFSS
jgi:hypothetical protein